MRPDFNAPKSDWIDYANDLELMAGVRRPDSLESEVMRLYSFVQKYPLDWKLGAPQEARLLVILSKRPEGMSKQAIVNQIASTPFLEPKLADVIVCRARQTFKLIWGINPIKTLWGHGYLMTPEAIKIIKKVIEGEKNGTEN
jgi:hypothetical protein